MPTLAIEVPDSVVAELETVAQERRCSVSEVLFERVSTTPVERSTNKRDQVLHQLREEGLLTPPSLTLSVEERERLDKRRLELARKLGKAGPLSEIIIQERR